MKNPTAASHRLCRGPTAAIRGSLFALFLCAACSALFAQAPSRYTLGTAAADGLFPIGWSAEGKFAYVRAAASSFRPDMVCRLVIQDLVTDKIVWDSGQRSMADLAESGKSLPKLNGEPLSAEYFFSYYYNELSPQLAKYGIASFPKADLFQFPCAVNGYTLDAPVVVRSKTTDEDFGEADVYKSFNFDLFMEHSALGKKKIFSENLANAYLFSVDSVGFFVSPFEKRAAVVLAYLRWGIEMEYSTDYRVVGSLYESGFSK